VTENILQHIVKEFREILDPIAAAAGDPALRREILFSLNLDPAQASQPIDIPPSALDSITAYTSSRAEDVDLEAFASVVLDVLQITQAVQSFINAASANSSSPFGLPADEAINAYLNMLTVGYVRSRWPGFYIGLKVFELIEQQAVRYGGIVNFLFKTGSYLKNLYGDSWSLKTEEHARNLSDGLLFVTGVACAGFLGADIQYGWDPDPASNSDLADAVSDRVLSLAFDGKTQDLSGNTVSGKLIMSIVLLPEEHQGPAVIVRLKGASDLTIPLKPVNLFGIDVGLSGHLDNNKEPTPAIKQAFEAHEITLAGSAKISVEEAGQSWLIKQENENPTFTIRREGPSLNVYVDEFKATISVDAPDAIIQLGSSAIFPSSTDAEVGFSIHHKASGEFRAVLGSPEGTHLFLGKSSLVGKVSADDYSLKLSTKEGRFTLSDGDGDSFINHILPSGDLKIDFNLGLGYSKKRGFFIEGGAGFLVAIPLYKKVGPVNLQTLTLGFKAGSSAGSSAVNLETSLSFSVKLRSLTAAVDRIGLTGDLSFPDTGGNLGPVDLGFGFKPPSGIGLAIDGGGFKGGGFLGFEPDDHRYVGFLDLEFKEKVAIKALGLLTTQLPDGSDGFSLLIIITTEFSPIQIGLGFTLNGVGGLLGLNRTANVDRLRTGIRDNTLSSILFPTDIVANANRIISDLRQVFPPAPDRFIFGPMAKIGWGTPTLLTIDLGLMIEVPDPVRILIVGVLRALLPDEDKRLLQLQVNFLGIIDFEAQSLSFDASISDSKLLTYTLYGDMAVRLSWGSDPNFLLSVGGFHPEYEPPPIALPELRRLSIQLLKGNNPRLSLETYFAITSNTVQFGAKLELYAAASKFNVYGFLSFDVLLRFNPFYFIASIGAMLALRVGSNSIASIKLELTLEGPTPWHAKGTAKFKICWFFTLKVRFNKTFGETRDTRLNDVAVLPRLQAALADSRNWEARTPDGRTMLVSLREVEVGNGQIVAHPFGIIRIAQKEVPLDIGIQKFGSQRSLDGNRFSIRQVQIEQMDQGIPQEPEPLESIAIKEQFAPAQFFERSDTEKLSSKSFEKYDAGVQLSETEKMDLSYAAARAVSYEVYYKDSQRNQRLNRVPRLVVPDLPSFNAWAVQGAISTSPLSHASKAKSTLAPKEVAVLQEPFLVVYASNLVLAFPGAEAGSQAGANFLMREMIQKDPTLEGQLQVVSAFEANRS
jgi:hypothetical protein